MKVSRDAWWRLSSNGGFTRIDLAVLILVVCLGAALANPLFTSHSRARADTLMCQANLADIGRAYQLWANDHEDRGPFIVPTSEGGLWQHPLAGNPYIQFAWVSNGLSSPKVLVCPADTNIVRIAKDFSANPDGGFMHPAYRNNAVGYFLSFHAQRFMPRSILSGDRNIDGTSFSGCSFSGGLTLRAVESFSTWAGAQWGQQIHSLEGNLVLNDGSVEQTSTTQLRAAVLSSDDDISRGVIHVLFPR